MIKKTMKMIIFLSILLVAINNFNFSVINVNASDLGLVGYWDFNQGSGSTAFDLSGNGNDGTIHGATWTTGVNGTALDFDGIDDYVLVLDGDSISIGNQDLTLSVWIKPFSLEESFAILSKTHDGHNKEFLLWYRDNSEPNRQIEYKIENWYDDLDYVATTDTTINLNQWQHVVVTFKADDFTTKIYHNGIQQNTIGSIDELPQMLDDDLTIGIYDDGNILADPFDGIIDEVKIYNRVLSDSEIIDHYEEYYFDESLESITVISPTSGVTWDVGDVNTISWTSENAGSYVDIDLYQDGYFYSDIASFEYNDGSYSWTVPSGLSSSSYYEILISESYDSSVYGYSGFFYISESLGSYITVSSPSSGVTWDVGDVNTISWTSENAGSYVDIDLYQDGYYHSIIALSTYNDGSYSWTVPSGLSASSYYEIRITDSYDSSIYDYSDSFYIDEPLESYITVSSPYSGDTWYQGDTSTISWSSYNAGNYVDIDLYQDGYYHSIIALSTYNDGSYSWTVPSGLNTDSYYEILITDSSDSSVYGYSGYLPIQKSPGLNFQEWIIIIAVFMVISLIIIIVVIVVIKGNPKGLPKEYRNRDTEEKLKLNKMKEKVKRWKKEGYNVDEIEQMIKSDKKR